MTGVSIIGVWESGRMKPARPDMQLTQASVLVIIGTKEQLGNVDDLLIIYNVNENPILIIGGGVVGRSAARALQRLQVPVHLVELDPKVSKRSQRLCKAVFSGDAADYELLKRAGVMEAPSVMLTTSDDAMNIYLTSYCRKLNPELRVVSRIKHERNLDAIHRAGADFVLSYASLGKEAVFSILEGKELIMLGEGVDLFLVTLPRSLYGKPLSETGIGARTGLNVIAIQHNGEIRTSPPASTILVPGAELLMLGSSQQRREFIQVFGKK